MSVDIDKPGLEVLLMGNEAIARGALEAGVRVVASYPGTPSTEITATLASIAEKFGLYVEWSVNEKVAMEVVAAASLSGLRSITAMKQNGINVAIDFLSNLNLTGVNKGMVIVLCDDCGGLSSSNEQDSRHVAKILDLPLLEPSTVQEAKDFTKFAFEVSEKMSVPCLVRSVTRISHARGNVELGGLPKTRRVPHFDTKKSYYGTGGISPNLHKRLHEKLRKIEKLFSESPFNFYTGPEKPELLIVTSGSGYVYSMEALDILSVKDSVGILKIGTSWPLPRKVVEEYLLNSRKILVVEEVDPFLESSLKEFFIDHPTRSPITFFGKNTGHIPSCGELTVDTVINAIAQILSLNYKPRNKEFEQKVSHIAKLLPSRTSQMCPGCPHRATYWALKRAIRMSGKDVVVLGDIGCYAMGVFPTGFEVLKTVHAMGSGMGLGSGLGKLSVFGFDQPVIAVTGDSTFFHAVIPALINAVHSEADVVLLITDNGGTAMTGFQPHPGIMKGAMGEKRVPISIERLCEGLGVPYRIVDPYDPDLATKAFLDVLSDREGVRVVISRRECALLASRKQNIALGKVYVDQERCLGESCGCSRFCTRIFRCPGLIWEKYLGKARIDEAICNKCGVCMSVCPQSAIIAEGR